MVCSCMHSYQSMHHPCALQESLSNQPSQAVLNEVRSIVHEAGRAAPEQESNQTGKMGESLFGGGGLCAVCCFVAGRGSDVHSATASPSLLIAAGGGHIINDADSLDAMIWGVVGRGGPEED